MEYIHYIDSPLGRILISGEDDSLTGLWFEGQKYFADTIRKDAEEKPDQKDADHEKQE